MSRLGPSEHAADPVVFLEDGDLTFSWYSQSNDKSDDGPLRSGLTTAKMSVSRDGHEHGYVKASFVTEESLATNFPRALYWLDIVKGWCVGLERTPDITPQEVWSNAHRYGPGRWGQAPTCPDPDSEEYEAGIRKLEEPHLADFELWKTWTRIPYVAYSRVKSDVELERDQIPGPSLLGTGLGTRLYELTARRLAEDGMVLAASGLQTPAAEAAWSRMAANGYPLRSFKMAHSTTRTIDRTVLDYT